MSLRDAATLAALLASTAALADEAVSRFALKGHFRFRAEGNERTDFSTTRDFFNLRLRTEMSYEVAPDLSFVATPQFSRTLGEPAYVTSPATGVSTRTQQSGGTSDPGLFVHEAYANWKLGDSVTFKPGRQVLSYGDELVIGALDWNNVGRSFDGARARFSRGSCWSDLFYAKLIDNNTVAAAGGDADLYGLYNSFSLGDGGPALDLYGLYQRDATGARATHLGAVGARLAGKSAVDYRLEATKELGSAFTEPAQAFQVDAEAGYTFDVESRPRLGAEYFVAGKQYNQLYPTVHKWLGHADVLGRRNVTGLVAHLSAVPLEGLTARFDFHTFSRVSTGAPAYKVNGTTMLGSASASSSKSIGSEADLTLSYAVSKPLTLTGGYSRFFSGDFLKASFGDVSPVFFFGQLELRF